MLEKVLGMNFDALVQTELPGIVVQIRALNQSIAELDRAIRAERPKPPGHENLGSIKRIGDLGATILSYQFKWHLRLVLIAIGRAGCVVASELQPLAIAS